MLLCQLPDTRNLRGRKTSSAWERETWVCCEVLAPLTPCVAGLEAVLLPQAPEKPRLIKSVAEGTKSHKGRTKLFPLCHTLASLVAPRLSCSFFSRIRSIFCASFFLVPPVCHSLRFSSSAAAIASDGWRGDHNCFVSRLCKQHETSLTLTGYTACQPCSLGGAERFCTPSPPPPSCPGSSVRSPGSPRLWETCVSQKLHFQRGKKTKLVFI